MTPFGDMLLQAPEAPAAARLLGSDVPDFPFVGIEMVVAFGSSCHWISSVFPFLSNLVL